MRPPGFVHFPKFLVGSVLANLPTPEVVLLTTNTASLVKVAIFLAGLAQKKDLRGAFTITGTAAAILVLVSLPVVAAHLAGMVTATVLKPVLPVLRIVVSAFPLLRARSKGIRS